MGFIFDKGEAVDVGSHGEHEFVYSGGTPVVDRGRSTLAYEAGTGLGGKIVAVVNGTDAYDVTPVESPESIQSFYDYDGQTGAVGSHGYWDFEEVRLWAYHDTSSNSYYLVVSAGKGQDTLSGGQDSYAVEVNMSRGVGGYAVTDGETGDGGDRFEISSQEYGWPNRDDGGDGCAIDGGAYLTEPTTFTLNHDITHKSVGKVDGIQEFSVVTGGGAPPGQDVVYAGRNGSIEITFNI